MSKPVVVQHHGLMTVTFDCQSQMLKKLYCKNERADSQKGCELIESARTHFVAFNFYLSRDLELKCSKSNFEKTVFQEWEGWLTGTKWMQVYRMLDPLCDLELWPWPWIFRSNFEKVVSQEWEDRLTWNKRDVSQWLIDMERKGCESIARKYDPLCDFELWPHPWSWPWIFKVKFRKSCISGMGRLIEMERKGCESIGCWTNCVTLSYGLDLGFSHIEKKSLYPWSGVAEWPGTKVMWVNRKLNPLCDFQVWPHQWHWP